MKYKKFVECILYTYLSYNSCKNTQSFFFFLLKKKKISFREV